MRGLFKWFILLIGMFSFMGFSSTADPPKNSSIVFTDNDVGTQAILVENKVFIIKTYVVLSSEKCGEVFISKLPTTTIYPYSVTFKGKKNPKKLNFVAQTTPYKSPRDILRC